MRLGVVVGDILCFDMVVGWDMFFSEVNGKLKKFGWECCCCYFG